MSLIVLLSIAAVASASLPPAPTAPIIAMPMAPRARLDGPPTTLDVEVRMGNEVVWSGPMRLSLLSPARFERRKSDAPLTRCTDGPARPGGSESSNLTVSLSGAGAATDGGFTLAVTWAHPGPNESCGMRSGSRTIGLTQGFFLEPNQDVTITGDGGLAVRLHRR